MERGTAKSMDCFAEYESIRDAELAVDRFRTQVESGRRPRLGDRAVRVELSSQEELMRQLFPHAKQITWQGCNPVFPENTSTPSWSSGFKGFVHKEEMHLMVRYAEHPARVSGLSAFHLITANARSHSVSLRIKPPSTYL